MLSRRITSADLAAVGQVDRHRLRNLLKDLPEFAGRSAHERVAVEYTRHDLTVVAVLCELERMGLRKDAIAKWVSPIQQLLLCPRSLATRKLVLTIEPPGALLRDNYDDLGAGVLVDLDKLLRLVEDYCAGADAHETRDRQRKLDFGAQIIGRSTVAANQAGAHRHG